MLYIKISYMKMVERVEVLIMFLVSFSSVNGIVGEGIKVNFIKEVIMSYFYFQENFGYVWEQVILNDLYNCKNIFVFIEGYGES